MHIWRSTRSIWKQTYIFDKQRQCSITYWLSKACRQHSKHTVLVDDMGNHISLFLFQIMAKNILIFQKYFSNFLLCEGSHFQNWKTVRSHDVIHEQLITWRSRDLIEYLNERKSPSTKYSSGSLSIVGNKNGARWGNLAGKFQFFINLGIYVKETWQLSPFNEKV